jgi:hypothetical protein
MVIHPPRRLINLILKKIKILITELLAVAGKV